MEKGLLDLHSLLRWIIIILLLISIYKAYKGWQTKKIFTASDKRVWLFTLISAHITFVLGLYQVLWGRYGILKADLEQIDVMKDSFYRFYWVEHPLFMIVAIILITLGHGVAKKNIPDLSKFKRAFWLFFIALLMILVAVPWPFRDTIGRALVPGG